MKPPTVSRRFRVVPVLEAGNSGTVVGFRVVDRELSRTITGTYVTRSRAMARADQLNGRWWREAEDERRGRVKAS